VRVMTLSASEMTPLAGRGNAVQYGVGVAVTEVGGFQSWRFEGAKPGEGDMTFEGSDGGGFVWSRARSRRAWRRRAGAQSRWSHAICRVEGAGEGYVRCIEV
jgi:hypothetical protein